jgi:hypothetical protein
LSEAPGDFENQLVETGFDLVTATVTEPEALTAEGIEALKSLVNLPADKATPQFLMAVARELAMDVHTVDSVIAKYGLTHAQYDFLATHNTFFKQALLQQVSEWQRLDSTQARLKAESAAALEEQLPKIAARMGSASEKLSDVVEAAKLFAKIAGVDTAPAGAGTAGERFTINIDLGAGDKITARSGPDPSAGEVAAKAGPITIDAEGR